MVPNPLAQMKSLLPHWRSDVTLSHLAIQFGIVCQGRGIVLGVLAIMRENLQRVLKSDLRAGPIPRPMGSNCENDVHPAQFIATQLARIDRALRNFGSHLEASAVL